MDAQNPYPDSPIAPNTPPAGKSSNNKAGFYLKLLIGLGVLSVILLITTLVFSGRAFINSGQLEDAENAGITSGKQAQKDIDEKAAVELAGKDLRTYTAPDMAGSFQVDVPKSWSLVVTPDASSNTITGIAMPDFVDTKQGIYALQFALKEQSYEEAKKPFDKLANDPNPLKNKAKKEEITVSGIKGVRYTGQVTSKIANGTVVLVPIRDKTFIIQTDDNTKYLAVYNAIVQNLTLNP